MRILPERRRVSIGKTSLIVPLVEDEDTTDAIARTVQERFERIETESSVVDTQKFALLAAFEFAAECRALAARQEADNRDLVRALERVTHAMRGLVERFQIDAPPQSPEKDK